MKNFIEFDFDFSKPKYKSNNKSSNNGHSNDNNKVNNNKTSNNKTSNNKTSNSKTSKSKISNNKTSSYKTSSNKDSSNKDSINKDSSNKDSSNKDSNNKDSANKSSTNDKSNNIVNSNNDNILSKEDKNKYSNVNSNINKGNSNKIYTDLINDNVNINNGAIVKEKKIEKKYFSFNNLIFSEGKALTYPIKFPLSENKIANSNINENSNLIIFNDCDDFLRLKRFAYNLNLKSSILKNQFIDCYFDGKNPYIIFEIKDNKNNLINELYINSNFIYNKSNEELIFSTNSIKGNSKFKDINSLRTFKKKISNKRILLILDILINSSDLRISHSFIK